MSWKVYQQQDNYGCNMLEYFKAFRQADRDSPLVPQRAWCANPKASSRYDAINDNLPTVSWIIPTSTQSEHPDYMPAAGAAFVASKIDAIAANPDVWAKTAFILNYDENDGIFDHVAPPVPPAGTPREFVNELARSAPASAFRASSSRPGPPAAGCAASRSTTRRSLQFLEKFTGVPEPNITDWRRKTFGDLTSAFRFDDVQATPPQLPNTVTTLNLARYEAGYLPKPTFPGSTQKPPKQEKGERKRVPRGSPRKTL